MEASRRGYRWRVSQSYCRCLGQTTDNCSVDFVQIKATFDAYSAMFLLLAKGWAPGH
jgi:hypothetical protein